MARMPYFVARPWKSSMLSLAILTLPSYSAASSSRMGATILHGPHHSAQKSTNTGTGDFKTSSPKFPSVRVTIFATAIKIPRNYPEPQGGSGCLIYSHLCQEVNTHHCSDANNERSDCQTFIEATDGRCGCS